MATMARSAAISGLLLWFTSAPALPQTALSIQGLPGALNWQNTPRSWQIDNKSVLTISANAKTDWFVDPFDGTVVLVQPEMEKRRSPLVSIPPFGRGFFKA